MGLSQNKLLAHSGGLELSSSAWKNRNNTFLHSMSPYFVWNFLSPLRSLLDHSGSRVGWHTHMESKFRRFHHSHLSTSSSGTWKWACVQVRKRCVHHILITGSEGGEKSPLMWVISWDNLGLVTSSANKTSPEISCVLLFQGIFAKHISFFSSCFSSGSAGVSGVFQTFLELSCPNLQCLPSGSCSHLF